MAKQSPKQPAPDERPDVATNPDAKAGDSLNVSVSAPEVKPAK